MTTVELERAFGPSPREFELVRGALVQAIGEGRTTKVEPEGGAFCGKVAGGSERRPASLAQSTGPQALKMAVMDSDRL